MASPFHISSEFSQLILLLLKNCSKQRTNPSILILHSFGLHSTLKVSDHHQAILMNDFPAALSLLIVIFLLRDKKKKKKFKVKDLRDLSTIQTYLMWCRIRSTTLNLFPKKSIPVFNGSIWGGGCCRTCHFQTDSCSRHMRTLKCPQLSDSVGCSSPLW